MTHLPVASATADQANTANHSGQRLETTIADVFRDFGLKIIPASISRRIELTHGAFVVRDAPYRNGYGSDGRIEFLLHLAGEQYLIESKRMTRPGSVDEKLAYVYLTASANLPQRRYILILDGTG